MSRPSSASSLSGRGREASGSSALGVSEKQPDSYQRSRANLDHRPVEDITLDMFYKPHTLSLLLGSISAIVVMAFVRSEQADYRSNIFAGLCGVVFFFLIISALAFPNGPFTRPHPILWRIVFGMSVLYLLMVQFFIQQDYATIRSLIVWFDPKMANYTIDTEKEYGADCWDVSFDRIYAHLDWFAFGHYWGWGMKALIIRHYGICWSISIMWELTEMVFGHLLPNFYECWWDNLCLDVLLCNGLGIFTGMQVVRYFEMREHQWESIKNIPTRSGKIKRALLQFTPESFSSARWLDPSCSWMRLIAVAQFTLMWQMVELNTFFVKHIFPMPVQHPICVARILIMGLMAAPATRQYYTYITDKDCDRLGSQVWVFIAIAMSELIFHIKFGLDFFSNTQISKMLIWVVLNIVISCSGLYVSTLIYKWRFQNEPSYDKIHLNHPPDSPSRNTRSQVKDVTSSGSLRQRKPLED